MPAKLLATNHDHTKPSRGHYKTGAIRRTREQKIVIAATHVFSLNGFAGTRMADIAKRADIPKANVHYYFKSKAYLYQKVLKNILAEWDVVLNQFDLDDDPTEALRHYIAEKMQFSKRYPEKSRVFAKEILSGAPYLQAHFLDDYCHWFQSRVAIFEHWIAQGKMADINPAHLLFMIWATTQHYADFAPQITHSLDLETLTEAHFQEATQSVTLMVLRACGLA